MNLATRPVKVGLALRMHERIRDRQRIVEREAAVDLHDGTNLQTVIAVWRLKEEAVVPAGGHRWLIRWPGRRLRDGDAGVRGDEDQRCRTAAGCQPSMARRTGWEKSHKPPGHIRRS